MCESVSSSISGYTGQTNDLMIGTDTMIQGVQCGVDDLAVGQGAPSIANSSDSMTQLLTGMLEQR